MAKFQTHLSVGVATGAVYGGVGFALTGCPESTAVLAGLFCAGGSILPDLDSQKGRPVREISAFIAALAPLLLIHRFQQCGCSREVMAVAGIAIYLAVRYALPYLFGRFTKHRGMWHSVPAAATAGLILYLLVSGDAAWLRIFKAGGATLGFLAHLILDEIWSVDWKYGMPRLKKSSGTALKFWGPSLYGNVSTYAKLCLALAAVLGDPMLMQRLGLPEDGGSGVVAEEAVERDSTPAPPLKIASQRTTDQR